MYAEAAKRAVGTALAHLDAETPEQTTAIANVIDCVHAFAHDLHGASSDQCIEALARSLALLIHTASPSPDEAAARRDRAARITAGALAIFQHDHAQLGGSRP